MATSGARKTPRGARPNRRGGLAQPEFAVPQGAAMRPSGRLLESRSDPGPRGMIAALHRTKLVCSCASEVGCRAQNPAYRLVRLIHFENPSLDKLGSTVGSPRRLTYSNLSAN